jgi:hypothetical protein
LNAAPETPEDIEDDTPMGELVVRWMEGQTLEQRLQFLDEITAVFCPSCGNFNPEDQFLCPCGG